MESKNSTSEKNWFDIWNTVKQWIEQRKSALRLKEGSYYHSFTDSNNNIQYALLHQIRYMDGRRIQEKLSSINTVQMKELKNKLRSVLEL